MGPVRGPPWRVLSSRIRWRLKRVGRTGDAANPTADGVDFFGPARRPQASSQEHFDPEGAQRVSAGLTRGPNGGAAAVAACTEGALGRMTWVYSSELEEAGVAASSAA